MCCYVQNLKKSNQKRMEKLLLGIMLSLFSLNISYAQSSISSIPSSPTNTFATDFPNLIVKAQFASSEVSTYSACAWSYYNGITVFFFAVATGSCIPMSTSNETVTCVYDGTTIISNLTLLQPLSAGSLNVSVVCDTATILTLPTTVQDCPPIISSDITVEASSYAYNAQGTFNCSNNGELFYSDGTRPSSSDTTCLASATWSGQDNLQCWSAPTNVTLVGNLTVVEGNYLTIACDYVDTIPSGTESVFYVGDATYTRSKNEALVLSSLQRSDNNKVVFCQAATPYTQIPANNITGRSSNHTINVQYSPFQDMQPPPCIWVVNQTGSCPVEFFSNPPSAFVSLTLYEISVINDGSNEIISSDYLQTYYYHRTKVTSADNGTYVLTVQTSVFPNNVSIFFDINVVDRLPTTTTTTTPKTTTIKPTTNDNLGLTIGVSCAAAVIVILIILFIIMYMRKRRGLKGHSNEADNNNIQLATDQPGYIEFNEIATNNQTSTTRQYEVVQPPTDEDGYLQVRGQSSRPHNYENMTGTGNYENMDGPYEVVI